jgi:hypothetical protein
MARQLLSMSGTARSASAQSASSLGGLPEAFWGVSPAWSTGGQGGAVVVGYDEDDDEDDMDDEDVFGDEDEFADDEEVSGDDDEDFIEDDDDDLDDEDDVDDDDSDDDDDL